MKSSLISNYLNDADPEIVRETARAITDVPIPSGLKALAAVALNERTRGDEVLLRRILAASATVGGEQGASTLLQLGKDSKLPEAIRVEAFEALASWTETTGRDRITGLWRPVAAKPASQAAQAAEALVADLNTFRPATFKVEAIRAIGSLQARSGGVKLRAISLDKGEIAPVRVAALKALDRLNDPGLAASVTANVDDPDSRVRFESHRLLAKLSPEIALKTLAKVWSAGAIAERRNALEILAGMNRPEADALVLDALEMLSQSKLPPELELDVREAAAKRSANDQVRERLAKLTPASSDPLAEYLACLVGGDRERGSRVFLQNTAVECLRCHKVRGQGGEVGPDLTGIGGKQSRTYLLESIVQPNKAIAQGFESVVVAKSDGTLVTGVFRGEDAQELRLMQADGTPVSIKKTDVEERKRGPSAMPDDLVKKLSKSEIRDLVEYLSKVR